MHTKKTHTDTKTHTSIAIRLYLCIECNVERFIHYKFEKRLLIVFVSLKKNKVFLKIIIIKMYLLKRESSNF